MRDGVRAHTRQVRELAGALVAPGVTTHAIDEAVHAAAIARDSYPSPLRYRSFPRSCCISVNEVVCHGIPDDRPLADGEHLTQLCFPEGVESQIVLLYRPGHYDILYPK